MSVRVVLRRLVAAVTAGVSATAVALTVPTAQAALPRAEDRDGSAGIGDPYFPLDGNGGIDVLRYDVRNRYGLHSGRLRGQTRLTIRATQPLDSFHLDFLLPVQQVTVDGRTVDFRRSGSHELVVQTRGIATGRHFTVVVDYDGRPAEHSYLGEQNWLAGDHEVVAMNQPHMAAWWYPSNDHPLDKARHDIRITVPRGREVVANGLLVGRERHGRLVTWHWRSTDPMASYLAFFAAGDFEIRTGRHQGLPWINAVSRELAPQARRVALRWLGRTPRITAWLTQEIGPYPFESTGGLVTSLWPGFALENQTRPTYPFVGGQADWLLVHELAHQWFGNSVAVEHWRDIWLNEGFATYFEARWVEARGGETVEQWLARSYDQHDADSTFWKTGVADPGPGGLFDSAVYERGGMTLAALRALLGVDTFQALVRTWAHEQHDGNGSTEEFVATAERVSGRELDGFFRAWLSVPTRPERVADNGLSARVG